TVRVGGRGQHSLIEPIFDGRKSAGFSVSLIDELTFDEADENEFRGLLALDVLYADAPERMTRILGSV
ncbi:hypothetical protein AB9K41_09050, partial [Cribrihabitans sp. XS_ASV171]